MLSFQTDGSLNYYDDVITNRDTVLCGDHAFALAGLTTSWTPLLQCSTYKEGYNNLGTYPITYYTMDSWNDLSYTHPSVKNPLVHYPTKERALVEAMIYEYFNEGILIESLITYITTFYDEKLLYEVADHFGLPRERLQYWLDEARYEMEHDEQ